MSSLKIPALGYALLGLLQMKPASGYDLRKIFSSSSMKTYSDSPGAIYPALNRLSKQGLIRGTVEQGARLRRREVFRLTPKGLSELKNWITRPITVNDLVRGQQEIMLRFAFSETSAGRATTLQLLKSLEAALQAHLPTLHHEFEALKTNAPTSGRLAFECGIRGYESLMKWTQYAITTYEASRK
jgi:PadR family transcriptional regulator AphA